MQTELAANWLAQQGHEVIISAFYGVRGKTFGAGNVTILPGSNEQWGNDVLIGHYDFYRPDVMFLLMDAWVLRDEVLDVTPSAVWTPIDHDPLPPSVASKLTHIKWPIAMSRHGEQQMRKAMVDPFYVPHMVNTSVYKPTDRNAARAAYGITDDRFTTVSVAANKGFPTRKNIDRILKAWGLFLRQQPGGLLYIHTNPYASNGGLDLLDVATFYGLRAFTGVLKPGDTLANYDVAFPDMYRMTRGDYGDEALNNAYNMADMFILPSAGEGFGVPAIEAQAAGCPVALTDFTAQSELAEAGYKIPVDPVDDMTYTLQQSEQALPKVSEIIKAYEWGYEQRGNTALRERAREFAMGYDVDRVMPRYMMPVFEWMAQGNADWMQFEQYKRNRGAA